MRPLRRLRVASFPIITEGVWQGLPQIHWPSPLRFNLPMFLQMSCESALRKRRLTDDTATVDTTWVPPLGKLVVREARSGERIPFPISAV